MHKSVNSISLQMLRYVLIRDEHLFTGNKNIFFLTFPYDMKSNWSLSCHLYDTHAKGYPGGITVYRHGSSPVNTAQG